MGKSIMPPVNREGLSSRCKAKLHIQIKSRIKQDKKMPQVRPAICRTVPLINSSENDTRSTVAKEKQGKSMNTFWIVNLREK